MSVGAGAIATVLSRLVGLARGVGLAWLIPQGQFGLFGVALLVVNVLLPLCSAGLYEGVTRYVPRHEAAGSLRRFLLRSAVLLGVVAVTITLVLSVFAESIGSLMFSAGRSLTAPELTGSGVVSFGGLTRVCLLCVVMLAAYHTLLGWLKGLRMFRAAGAAELATACLFTLLALFAATAGFPTARALIIAYAVACAISVAVFVPGLIRRVAALEPATSGAPPRSESGLLGYSGWAAGSAVLWHALSYYPMWYLLKVSDAETVGTFHAVRIPAQLVQVGAVMLAAIVAANVNRMWEQQGREAAALRLTLLTKACLVALITGAAVLAAARGVVMRMFPEAFAIGAQAYAPMVLFFLLVGIVGLVSIRLNLVEKPRWVCLAWCVGAAVNVATSYVLLDRVDTGSAPGSALQAAAWAGVAGAAAALLVCALLVRRERLALDTRTVVLILAAFSIGFGPLIAVCVVSLLLALAIGTSAIFTPQERIGLGGSTNRDGR